MRRKPPPGYNPGNCWKHKDTKLEWKTLGYFCFGPDPHHEGDFTCPKCDQELEEKWLKFKAQSGVADPHKCKHANFNANVTVNRIEDTGQFSADITISCAECRLPFEFVGLPMGLDFQGAAVSTDNLEARLTIIPQGSAVVKEGVRGFRVQGRV